MDMDEPEQGLEEMILIARGIIGGCEAQCGLLTSGQRRDLLKDNAEWDGETCDEVVRLIDEEDARFWRGLMAVSRIRMYGSANVEGVGPEPYDPDDWVHFGADFWSKMPPDWDPEKDMQSGRHSTDWGLRALKSLSINAWEHRRMK